jgi:hypothetical protein
MTTSNTKFKTYWLSLPMEEAKASQAVIKSRCGWDSSKWYRIIHGKTQITPAEQEIICSVFGVSQSFLFPLPALNQTNPRP